MSPGFFGSPTMPAGMIKVLLSGSSFASFAIAAPESSGGRGRSAFPRRQNLPAREGLILWSQSSGMPRGGSLTVFRIRLDTVPHPPLRQ
jgi:hypothetical protein